MRFVKILLLLYFSFTSICPAAGSSSQQSSSDNLTARLRQLIIKADNEKGPQKLQTILQLSRLSIKLPYPQGIEIIQKGIILADSLSDKAAAGNLHLNKGILLYMQSYFPESMDELRTALKILKEVQDNSGTASALNELAYVNSLIGEFESSVQYAIEADKISTAAGDKRNSAYANSTLGIQYSVLKEEEKALSYSNKGLALAREAGDTLQCANVFTHLGIISIFQKRFTDARCYFDSALALYENQGNIRGISGAFENTAIVLREQGQTDKAIEYCKKSIELKKLINDRRGLAASYANLGLMLLRMKDYDASIDNNLRAFKLRDDTKDIRGLATLSLRLSEAYEAKYQLDNALRYYKLHKTYSDSIYGTNRTRQMHELTAKYEDEKKIKEINYLVQQAESSRKVFILLVVTVILACGIGIALTIGYIQKRKSNSLLAERNEFILNQNRKLEQLNEELTATNAEKDKLFGIIAHDLRSPFQSILGVGQLLIEEKDSMSREELTDLMMASVEEDKKLYKLIDNLLNWSLIRMGRLDISYSLVFPSKEFKDICSLFATTIAQKQITVDNSIPEELTMDGDRNSLIIVFRNLLSNAVKFTPSGGTICLSAEAKEKDVVISIADSGVGIDEDRLATLFTHKIQSTRGTNNESGTGLGLMICMEIVEMHKGTISVNSTRNKGTRFTITLPAKK